MNWIILIIAGLCEVGFASCLGKAKEATGNDTYYWYGGFLVLFRLKSRELKGFITAIVCGKTVNLK